MFEDFEFEDKFNPWTVASLDDFLFYCCPECDYKSITKSVFIKHAVNNHPRSQDVIDSLNSKTNLTSIKIENENNNDDNNAMDFEESAPTLTASNKVTDTGTVNDPNGSSLIPNVKKVMVSLPKLNERIIRMYTTGTEMKNIDSPENSNFGQEEMQQNQVEVSKTVESSDSNTDNDESQIKNNVTVPPPTHEPQIIKTIWMDNSHESAPQIIKPMKTIWMDGFSPSLDSSHGCSNFEHISLQIKGAQTILEDSSDKASRCDDITSDPKVLREQRFQSSQVNVDPTNVRYNCDRCEKSYSCKNHLDRHIKSVHENVRYNCDLCDKSFSAKTPLNRHIKSVHENVRYNCDLCDKSCSQKADLKAHIKSVHENVRYNCHDCEKSFSLKHDLKRHITSIHKNNRHQCQKCHKSFSQKADLKAHIKIFHENVQYNSVPCAPSKLQT